MYGTIWRVRPKPGKDQDVIRLMEEWQNERGPKVKGARGGYVYKLDNGGLMGAVSFDSKDDYMANAADPAQHAWYEKWRALLEADPEWSDGEIVTSWHA